MGDPLTEFKTQVRTLVAVNRIALAVVAAQSADEILRAAVNHIREQLQVEIACLLLVDPVDGRLLSHASSGGAHEAQHRARLSRKQDVIRRVLDSGTPWFANNVTRDPNFYPGVDPGISFQTCSILCVPLLASDQTVGAAEVVNKQSEQVPGLPGTFEEQDRELLEAMVAIVAPAALNARWQAARREEAASKAVRQTVVTLAHHVNNPLQGLVGAADMLREQLDRGIIEVVERVAPGQHPDELLEVIVQKAEEISAVLLLLQEASLPHTTAYLGQQRMLDIAEELKKRMANSPNESQPSPPSA